MRFRTVAPNQVRIITIATSLGPVDVEKFVSFPIETSMSGLPGIEQIRSVSLRAFACNRLLPGKHGHLLLPASGDGMATAGSRNDPGGLGNSRYGAHFDRLRGNGSRAEVSAMKLLTPRALALLPLRNPACTTTLASASIANSGWYEGPPGFGLYPFKTPS
jgi:hypothetical protein